MTSHRTAPVVAVLDANILYPAPLRDFFMWLAANHVFAARWTNEIHAEWIECDAAYIVTRNLDDFPNEVLSPHGIEAAGPDEFGRMLLRRLPGAVARAADEHRKSLRNPPKSVEEYLESLRRTGLPATSRQLARHM